MARTEKQNPMAQSLDDLAGVFRRGSGHAGQQAWGQDRALMQILRYFKKEEEAAQPPAEMESQEERIDFILRPTGILRRRVRLEGAWWKDAMCPLLGRRNGEQVALLPGWGGGYYFLGRGRQARQGRPEKRPGVGGGGGLLLQKLPRPAHEGPGHAPLPLAERLMGRCALGGGSGPVRQPDGHGAALCQ